MSTEGGGASHAPTFGDLFVAYRNALGKCFPELSWMHWPKDSFGGSFAPIDFIDVSIAQRIMAELNEQSKKLIDGIAVWTNIGRTAEELGVELADLFINQRIAMNELNHTTRDNIKRFFASFLNGYLHAASTRPSPQIGAPIQEGRRP